MQSTHALWLLCVLVCVLCCDIVCVVVSLIVTEEGWWDIFISSIPCKKHKHTLIHTCTRLFPSATSSNLSLHGVAWVQCNTWYMEGYMYTVWILHWWKMSVHPYPCICVCSNLSGCVLFMSVAWGALGGRVTGTKDTYHELRLFNWTDCQ